MFLLRIRYVKGKEVLRVGRRLKLELTLNT